MTREEYLERLVTSRAGTSLRAPPHNPDSDVASRLGAAVIELSAAPLLIDDRADQSLARLGASLRRMGRPHPLALGIVDYLGLVRSGDRGRSRYEETTEVSNGLKRLAKDLRIPLLVLAQLNRDSEREDRMPRLSDLRDSGAIEQDADLVLLLHRDAEESRRHRLIVAKHRNGPTGIVNLQFQAPVVTFSEDL